MSQSFSFERLLVPYDGSALADQTLPMVVYLAPQGAEVILLQVVPDHGHEMGPEEVWQDGEALERAKVLAQRDLHRAADWLTAHRADLRITHLTEVGDPATEILHVAERLNAGVIVLASAGHAGVGRLATGTVAERVTRHADRPVLLIRLTDTTIGVSPPPLTRLMVPLDGSDLAAQALPVAQELASRLQLPVHLITVIDPEEIGAPVIAYEATISPEIWQECFASARLDAQVRLERLCASLIAAGITSDWEIVEGRVAQTILERCRPGDLLVMTTRGRSGARLWRIGSIADKIVRYTAVPVLVLPVREVRETVVPVVEELPAWPRPGAHRG